jgi:hypothetical protein
VKTTAAALVPAPAHAGVVCLLESPADMFAFGLDRESSYSSAVAATTAPAASATTTTTPGDGRADRHEVVCPRCLRSSPCGAMFALNCRHYCCASCWQAHIVCTLEKSEDAYVPCIACNSISESKSSRDSFHSNKLHLKQHDKCSVAVVSDLVALLCSKETLLTFLKRKLM